MFEFSRELKRLLKPHAVFTPARDGLTGGDIALLELLDVDLLEAEAKASDVAAGRIGARDRAALHIHQSSVWRELARRTGDGGALRKAASAAELAIKTLDRAARPQAWARARTEQALCAMLGAELFGDQGLNAAADFALAEASAVARRGPANASAQAGRARIGGLMADTSDASVVLACADQYDRALGVLDIPARGRSARLPGAQARADRGEMLLAAGQRFKDDILIARAIADLDRAAAGLDAAYEPVTAARVACMRGQALVALGELQGEARHIAQGVAAIAGQVDQLSRDHSPLDWARAQLALAHGLQSLGEVTESDEAFDQALCAYDRALMVLKRQPSLGLTATACVNRALCLARRAELGVDLIAIDAAEAAFRCELAAANPGLDPVRWAVCQLSLARIYETRMDITGQDRGLRAKAAIALTAALEVFGEQGLRSLSDVASIALERLRMPSIAR